MVIAAANNPFDIVLTSKQIEQVQNYAIEIINSLPPKAVNELLEGYNHDQEALMNEIFRQINTVVNFNATLESEKLDYLEGLEKSMDNTLKKLSYNYFKTTCLPGFDIGWHTLEWGNLAQLFPWSLFLASRSHGKCFAKGTKVVMFDGSLKNIEDIIVGDELMGIDNQKRTVLSLHSGIDEMYEVEQKLFKNYVVNSKHDIYFKKWKRTKINGKNKVFYDDSLSKEIRMSAEELFKKNNYYFEDMYGCGVDGWDLSEKCLSIEPYFLGYWLGDGNRLDTRIATIDKETVEYLKEYASRLGLKVTNQNNSIIYSIVSNSKKSKSNYLLNELKRLNLYKNKHIPQEYMTSSRKQRLELLAGLLDSDGHNPKGKINTYIFYQKDENLIKQVQNLCWSLGFRANITKSEYKTKYTSTGVAATYVLHISGKVHQIPCKIKRKISIEHCVNKSPQRRGIKLKKIGSGEYFGFMCDKDHLFLLEDGTIVSNSMEWCFSFSLWRSYSYDRPLPYQRDTLDNKNRKETLIITNESTLGKRHLGLMVDEILSNQILSEKINPNGKAELGKEHITTESGSMIKLRSLYSSGIRGNHCGTVVYDDLLDESSLYSKEQRAKAKEIFIGSITPVVEPGGFFIGSGTPYVNAPGDIYTDLKSDSKHMVWEYPAICPYYDKNGKLTYRLLNPSRFSYKSLLEIQKSIGSAVFSREYMVTPVTDDSSIFPYEYLNKCIQGMETVRFVENIESFPYKLQRVVIGVDWAKSGNVSADYTVITVMGLDSNENYYILNIWRKKGAPYNEQINQLVAFDQRYRPNKIIVENNGFQSIMSDLANSRGLKNIEPFTTTGFNKKNSYEGLPSIAAIMERGQLRVPYSEGYTREMVDIWMSEFNSVAYNEDSGKLEGVGAHDDMCMSTFFAIQDLRTKTTKFKFTMV